MTTPERDPQVGENTCPDCAGEGGDCRTCGGSGVVQETVGDA